METKSKQMQKEGVPDENFREAMASIADMFFVNDENASTLYLIRHGQHIMPTVENNDPQLTSQGITHSHRAGERLKAYGITQLLSSPLLRTRQTGDIIGSHIGLPNQIVADLQELKQLKDFQSYASGFLAAAKHMSSNNRISGKRFNQLFWPDIHGLESGEALRVRAVNIIDSILNKYPGQKIAVVTHMGFINAYVSELLALNGDGFFIVENTGISIVRAYRNYRALICLNDASHIHA